MAFQISIHANKKALDCILTVRCWRTRKIRAECRLGLTLNVPPSTCPSYTHFPMPTLANEHQERQGATIWVSTSRGGKPENPRVTILVCRLNSPLTLRCAAAASGWRWRFFSGYSFSLCGLFIRIHAYPLNHAKDRRVNLAV